MINRKAGYDFLLLHGGVLVSETYMSQANSNPTKGVRLLLE